MNADICDVCSNELALYWHGITPYESPREFQGIVFVDKFTATHLVACGTCSFLVKVGSFEALAIRATSAVVRGLGEEGAASYASNYIRDSLRFLGQHLTGEVHPLEAA